MEKLHQDYKEFIESLNKNEVEYLVIGAFAMAFHGHPRYTGDIDFWIKNNEQNAGKIYKAIIDFGFPADELSVNVDGLMVNVLNIEDLKKNKKADGRKKDLADLEELNKNK